MSARHSGWIDAGGICQRYALSGAGSKTLVLVHEMGGSIESWDAVVGLLESDHRLLCYDQRGFGMSEKHQALTLDHLVTDLAALLDALGIAQPVVLAGAAMGAASCLAFALRYPQRTAGVMVSSPATGGLSQAARAAQEARLQKVRDHGMRGVTDEMLEISYPALLRTHPDAFELLRRRWLTIDPCAFIELNRMMNTFDLVPQLPQIGCPVQIIGCTHDAIRPPARSQEIAAHIPGALYIERPSGHFMPLQTPGLFADALRQFAASWA